MATASPANPYPGLRAFEPNESELFFGRERETDELRRRLRTTRLLAVVGSSGSGKSSLVRSGLIPSLHSGFMAGAGSSWRVAITRPGEDPIGRLAEALDQPEVLGTDDAHADTRRTVLEVMLRDSSLGLAETVRQARLPVGDNVLVVVDQFEELFRYRRSRAARAEGDDAAAFVRLLLEAARCADLPIYVALTMRSEFIGECVAFDGLPEAINTGQYLIPRMSRDALRAAISGPAAVRGVAIAPRLLVRLLNEIGDDLDRLPVLQHALMRTWDARAREHDPSEPLDVRHYEAIGTMKEALSRHADEAYAELEGDRERGIAERLFKALTETTEDGRGMRRPAALRHLAEVCEASMAELERVIDRFRAPGRAFLQPAAGVKLEPQHIVDLAHESLMRLWDRLVRWVREEARAEEIYRRLLRSAVQHAAGEASLWRSPELAIGLRWQRENRPSAAWAGGDPATFEQAMRFLRASRRVHRLKVGLAAAGVAIAVALAIGWFYREADRQRRQAVALQAQVDQLRAQISEARPGYQAQSEQVQALRERQAMLKSDVAGMEKARRELEAQVASVRETNRALETELARLPAESARLVERNAALDQAFARLVLEADDLEQRARRLERATPALQAQMSTLQAQLEALRERNRALTKLVEETLPCDLVLGAEAEPDTAAAGPEYPTAEQLVRESAPPSIPPDPTSSDALRRQIEALARELAQLLEDKARLQDEAGWLERENALLDRQREALQQENARLVTERDALEVRQRALREAAERAEAERKVLADRAAAGERRNDAKLAEVEAVREKHRDLERRAVAEAHAIGATNRATEQVRADNQRLVGELTAHVDRLLRAARGAQVPGDLAALLALKAWRWAPYDSDDAAHPAVYNTLWLVLDRLDEATAGRLIAPGDRSTGKLATTRSEALAQALCERVTRPLTEAEWRRFMPADACFTSEAAQPCAR